MRYVFLQCAAGTGPVELRFTSCCPLLPKQCCRHLQLDAEEEAKANDIAALKQQQEVLDAVLPVIMLMMFDSVAAGGSPI